MTVDERDHWECLVADWSTAYEFSLSDGEADELPFKAVPHADRNARLEAASSRLLRDRVRQDHARRAAAAEISLGARAPLGKTR